MKKRKSFLLISLISLMSLTSCGSIPENHVYTYTVIWQNFNGDILEIDRNLSENTIPTYDGEQPTRQGNGNKTYVFKGWSPEVTGVTTNTTYTAMYEVAESTYTITWQNYNGEVLEIDNNVPYGVYPTYDGSLPTKENEGNTIFMFAGWSPELEIVSGNATYVATFSSSTIDTTLPSSSPSIDSNSEKVFYGYYPQTHIKDETLIETLNKLQPTTYNNWYLYEGSFYVKEKAKLFNNETFTFNDGTSIVDGTDYWYRCDAIEWKIIEEDPSSYTLISTLLLDTHNFYKGFENRIIDADTIYPNNYKESDVRSWLNNEFYNTAFVLNGSYIKQVEVDNSSATTDSNENQYVSTNTLDKVYLASYKDYQNKSYGFDKDLERCCKTTDYSRARGAWYSKEKDLLYNGTYWTRSPSSEYYYSSWNVNSGGYLSNYAVDGDNHCVRPCITISK